MQLESLLVQKKNVIMDEWFNLLVETYPAETGQFLKRQSDPFANPVGSTTRRGLDAVFDELMTGMDHKALSAALDPIIRIRAIQNFTPSQALAFVFLLKKAVRKKIQSAVDKHNLAGDLLSFESKIDQLALFGFDIYMGCREKIYQLMEKEVKNRALRAFEQEGLIHNKPA
ncbi:MAG: RsbRD N-terminal domain-containing protein [Deltaproteobacteria bacterium]|nr:RsbRD N-terminal domain-containing protein [Deltaproteobacteria bacterium]